MNNKLFSGFDPVSSKQWKQKIQFDLKGINYNDVLIWKTNEDISVKPFYHADDFVAFPEISNTKATQWKICQSIYVAQVEKSNIKATNAIERGAESISFIIPSKNVSIENLIKNIDISSTIIYFELRFLSLEFIKKLLANTRKHLSPSESRNENQGKRIHIHIDIIGNLARTGNWFNTLQEDHNDFKAIVKEINSFSVDMSLYQNAGATMVQQLAYALAHANEYLNHFENLKANEPLRKSSFKAIFKVSVGTNYFFEISKLRALRLLWKTLASEYDIDTDCHILATPTKRNKTLYDYNNNLLRTTTECMSAILGGANTICNLPYDAIYHKDNEFGERISRNQLLVLKHESYFNKVNNPADGAYYIESLTHQLAEKAIGLFKNIEANGGFLEQLKAGTIQRKTKESASKEQKQFNAGKEVLLGTNKHPNPNDLMKQELELYPFVKTNQRKTLLEPIIEKRLPETLEQKRLLNEH